MKKNVFITDYIESPNIEFDVLGNYLSDNLSEEIEYIIVWHQKIDKNYIDNLPNLKGIVRYGVGYDQIDIDYCRKRNIVVCNTPDYGTDEVSDTALAMIMNITRGISRYDYFSRSYFDTWQENTIKSIKRNNEIKLGVIGAGRIGGSLILKANALRFQTFFYDPYVVRGHEKMLNSIRLESLKEILNACDIISINCPLNSETKAMVDDEFISMMKDGASLVNTARGGIISNIDVFYKALKEDKISNVSLDVLPEEPPKKSLLLDAWRGKAPWLDGRFIINPHTAYYSDKSFLEMRYKAACNILRMIQGKSPYNRVDNE
jgi:D-3-phosphoglycerate dehydrogenase